MRQGGVDRYPMKPGWKCRFASERIELADDLQQHILGYVFGIRIVAQHAPSEGINPRGIIPEYFLDGNRRPRRSWLGITHRFLEPPHPFLLLPYTRLGSTRRSLTSRRKLGEVMKLPT